MQTTNKVLSRESRHPTHVSIILEARGFGRYFVVKNLSRSGAGISGQKNLKVGERVALNFGKRRLHATVRWATENKAGVVFERGLRDTELRELVRLRGDTHGQSPNFVPPTS